MDDMKQNIKGLIKSQVSAIDSNANVILFGSRAREDESLDSDWDILILTDYPSDLAVERKFREPLYELETELEQNFSVFVFSKEEWKTNINSTPFFSKVSSEGIYI